jgi:hypothetical protein
MQTIAEMQHDIIMQGSGGWGSFQLEIEEIMQFRHFHVQLNPLLIQFPGKKPSLSEKHSTAHNTLFIVSYSIA